MFDKLAATEQQYEELMNRLGSAELQSDPAEYRKQAKALSDIEETVERFRFFNEVLEWHAHGEELAIFPVLEDVAPQRVSPSSHAVFCSRLPLFSSLRVARPRVH